MTLRSTNLIQRLKGPRPYANEEGIKPHHVFGGGLLGLSKDAWSVLDPICTIDYMGAAEYEFGTLPQCLNTLAQYAQEQKLRSFAFVVGPHERELNWSRKYPKKGQAFPPAKYVGIYGIAVDYMLEEVQDRVRLLLSDSNSFHVKRGTDFTRALDPLSEYEAREPTLGWFELNNHFLIFQDRTMWENFCALFEVQKCDLPAVPVTVDYTKMDKKALVATAVSLGMFRNKTHAGKVRKGDLIKALLDAQAESNASLSGAA